MRVLALPALAFALLAVPACDIEIDDDESDFPSSTERDLEKTLHDVVAAGVAPGVSVAIHHPDHGWWTGAAGVADLGTRTRMTPSHRFRAGSMLKPLIATAVLRQVESGALALDDTLPALLPSTIIDRIAGADALSVGMLLRHTSGIVDFAEGDFDARVQADPRHVWTLDEKLDRIAAEPPVFAPGTRWGYSNSNYLLLGEILAGVTGTPWRQAVRDDVVDRADLDDTALPSEGDPSCGRCARGYDPIDDKLHDLTEVDPSMAGAAGGHALVTTPRDLAGFLDALLTDDLFDDDATLPRMLELTEAPIPDEAQTHGGLGVFRFQVGDVEWIGHLGGTAGYQGFMLRQPTTGVVVSGFMSQRGDLGAFILPVLEAVGRL